MKKLIALLSAVVLLVTALVLPMPTAMAEETTVWSAKDILNASLAGLETPASGTVTADQPADAAWKAMTLDANNAWQGGVVAQMKADQWIKEFGIAGQDCYVMPRLLTHENGVVFDANPWGSATWWDASQVAFTAPSDGTYVLSAGNYKKISSISLGFDGDGVEHWTLTAEGGAGLVAIYKNQEKLWPADKDYATVTHEAPIDFPTLEVNLVAGDVIRVIGTAGTSDGTTAANPNIALDGNYGWWISGHGRLVMDPIITKKASSTEPETPKVRKWNAKSILSASLDTLATPASGTVSAAQPSDAAWKAMLFDINSEYNGFTVAAMKADQWVKEFGPDNNTSYSMSRMTIHENGISFDGNPWASESWWDGPQIVFTAPESGKYVLSAADYKKISSKFIATDALGNDHYSLTAEDGAGLVAIYKNNDKLWPTDRDYATVTHAAPIDFPTLEVELAAGDMLRIVATGGTADGKITANPNKNLNGEYGGSWISEHCAIVMDPVITKAYTATVHKADLTIETLSADANDKINLNGLADKKNGYVFAGWYTDAELTTLFDESVALTSNIDLYAKFIEVASITADSADEFGSDTRGFGVLGAQIRPIDNSLRFVTRISKATIDEIEAIGEIKEVGIALVSENYFAANSGELLKGDGTSTAVNKNTVTNVKAVNIYSDYADYYRFTAVITGLKSDKQKSTAFCARAYITYIDANGVEQTYYAAEADNDAGEGNYKTGNGAYWKSFNQAYADLNS